MAPFREPAQNVVFCIKECCSFPQDDGKVRLYLIFGTRFLRLTSKRQIRTQAAA